MQEIDKRIGLLRLLLADVDGRIQQQQEISGQYRVQIARIVDAVVRQAGDVGQALTAMAEVEERLAQIETAGEKWVRFLYAYPNKVTQRLLDTIAEHAAIARDDRLFLS